MKRRSITGMDDRHRAIGAYSPRNDAARPRTLCAGRLADARPNTCSLVPHVRVQRPRHARALCRPDGESPDRLYLQGLRCWPRCRASAPADPAATVIAVRRGFGAAHPTSQLFDPRLRADLARAIRPCLAAGPVDRPRVDATGAWRHRSQVDHGNAVADGL